jgi:hypothetical protein
MSENQPAGGKRGELPKTAVRAAENHEAQADRAMLGTSAKDVDFRPISHLEYESLARSRIDPSSVRSSLSVGTDPDRSPTHSHAADVLRTAVRNEFRYALVGLAVGLVAILSGTALTLHGAFGSTSWTARLLGLESSVNDAAPGVILFVVGILITFITRPRVELEKLRG